MCDLHAAKHMVAGLDEDPARNDLLFRRRIDDFTLKGPVSREPWTGRKQKCRNDQPPNHHEKSDAAQGLSVFQL